MRSLLARLFILLTLFFPFTVLLAAETYHFDPQHTYVLWRINHLGFSIQYGKFSMVDGTLVVDEAKPQNSKVNVTINMDKVTTGIPKLDEHLLSSDFFDVEKYPTATFV
ncbi:MAG: YceI family protein, partial [Gammaproteobacteria bacterium]|nr:YceI family protein [Gammaproteobacteria bacterium]